MWDGYVCDGGDIREIAIGVRVFELCICIFDNVECILSRNFFIECGDWEFLLYLSGV